MSLQNALNKFFKSLGRVFQVPSASAYCQARQKIKAEVFVHLNASVRDDFYELDEGEEKVEKWHGHRLVGSDGTYLNLPDKYWESRLQILLCFQARKPLFYLEV